MSAMVASSRWNLPAAEAGAIAPKQASAVSVAGSHELHVLRMIEVHGGMGPLIRRCARSPPYLDPSTSDSEHRHVQQRRHIALIDAEARATGSKQVGMTGDRSFHEERRRALMMQNARALQSGRRWTRRSRVPTPLRL